MNLKNLSTISLEELLIEVKEILDIKNKTTLANNEIARENINITSCPNCNGTSFKKNGTAKGAQRYLCYECNKTFGLTNNTFIYSSNLTYEQWSKFIVCELEGKSLRNSAQCIGASTTTCFAMRHKLYGAISKIKAKTKLKKSANRPNVHST